MTGAAKPECRDLAGHQLHICQLKKKGLSQDASARTGNPAYICHNCNATANQAEDLCNPSPMVRRS